MSRNAQSLAALDQAPTLLIDPGILEKNLAALRFEHTRLAHELQTLALPAHWRPVSALDGFPTWRTELPGAPPHWLAGTAAPDTRARATLEQACFGDANILLPSVGAGAEALRSLERLGVYQAVFVCVPEPMTLAATLRTVDLATEIESRRCWFLQANNEEATLTEFLQHYPGLLAPTVLLRIPDIPPNRISALRDICERVARHIATHRKARLAILQADWPNPAAHADREIRLGLLALNPDPAALAAARELESAASADGWTMTAGIADSPPQVGPLVHAERLRNVGVDIVVCVNHGPEMLPIPSRVTRATWHLQPLTTSPAADLHLACSPTNRRDLKKAGIADSSIVDFFWGCRTDESPPPVRDGPILIAEDLPDCTADGAGITQATHRLLWEALLKVVQNELRAGRLSPPDGLLIAAERQSGVRLQDEALRQAVLELVQRRAVPGVALELLVRSLLNARQRVRPIGSGWQRLSDLSFEMSTESPAAFVTTTTLDAWTQSIAPLAGQGVPLIVFEPTPGQSAAQLDGILELGKHYDVFQTISDLPGLLESLRRDEAGYRRRAERLRGQMRTQHTWTRRLTLLAKRLKSPV